MHLALFQPDIPQNAGSIMRLGACLGVPVDLIEPAGFIIDDKRMRRAGMDYIDRLTLIRHASWERFQADRAPGRLVLLTTKGATPYPDFAFRPDDILILGRESSGVPEEVHEAADARLVIPLLPDLRSINVAQAAAMVLGEALRQTGGFPAATAPANWAPANRAGG
ncbi:tRNA (cytidine(34)-2'-O)-methyltransferase [Oceanibaculum nanhaiense]|jgi:tRNA (cytidine/uridine-2'-O-)-methyltransferase|uniref:tRNA (cytidine(34)-2'-O)-methyltransferase n=1 Tax=Oceanibaculum nanhaiense TaxID=1909734 RepID=UPI000A36D51D|nr:tRNA (cytidine(34)-2'-O)-methyltransferase [Oceanibaculum nanhaiense]MBC7136566.1 tRNA (cytidine(34)-2'-O)-methyltransferase [Oceanibaculum nanhaiense]|tara:strand:- start:50 stop:547 length:498 start_codon:yes stop_codon:yes gene_type:complete